MKSKSKDLFNILITGPPGVGKTTLLLKVVREIAEYHPIGFYTEEIREKGSRVGFRAVGLDGQSRVLSHVGLSGPYRVGRYGVDIKGFEQFLKSLDLMNQKGSIIVVDEIGKMECLSKKFRTILVSLFESPKTILATVAQKGGGLIEALKSRADSVLYEITPENREKVFSDIVGRVAKRG